MSIKFTEGRNSLEKIYSRNLQKKIGFLKASLQNELNLTDFAHVSTLFF